jgi:hypothetical protein
MTHRTLILAGSDAHARLALMDVDPGENRWTLPLPGYEASFRALSVRVTPDRPLTGDAAADSVSLLHGLRAGHTYIAVDGLAAPAFFEFTASNHSGRARQGDELRDDGEVTLRVRSNAPVGFRTAVFRDDVRIETSGAASELTVKAPSGPAVYRVEIRSSDREDAPVWLMSNPIYVRGPRSDTTVSRPAPGAEVVLFNGKSSEGWRVEAVAPAAGTMALTSEVIELHYTSPSGRAAGSVALLAESAEVPRSDRLTLSIRADRPMRPSVQLRMNRPGYPAERWQRTIYVDETLRTYVVYFDELTPVDPERSSSLPLEHMPYVLIAIDPEKMGKEGRLQITRAALHRR